MTGNELKNARLSNKLTQVELANTLGVTKQQVYRWESTGKISLVYKRILLNYFKTNKL